MTNLRIKRGMARRVRVCSTAHYNRWRLHEGGSVNIPRPSLSPSALWMLLAYLPPEVRLQPWVRQLVERELTRIQAERKPGESTGPQALVS